MTEKKNSFRPLGFVLYEDETFDWKCFRKILKNEYGITSDDEVKDNSLVFEVDGSTMVVSFMPFPIPDGEAEENAKRNYLWRGGADEVAKHKSNVILTMFHSNDGKSLVENYTLFIKFADCLLKCPGSIGIYTNETVYPSDFYIDHAEMLEDDDLPTPIMIYIGLYQDENGKTCGYTYGLESFGYREIEVIGSEQLPGDMYEFFFCVTQYVLDYDVTLQDGETIGFSEEQKLPITLSDGVALDGETLKIEY